MAGLMRPEDDQGTIFVATAMGLLVMTLIAIILRLISRWLAKVGLWWDDYLILFSEFLLIAAFTIDTLGVKHGAGQHLQDEKPEKLNAHFRLLYANMLFFPALMTLIKSSLICLYLRLFGANKGFTIASYTLLAITIAGGAASLLAAVFECSPIQAAWKPEIQHQYCINLRKYDLSTTITNSCLDFVVLILPLVLVGRLKGHSMKRKIAVSAIFLVGIFTFATSVLRSVAVMRMDRADPSLGYLPTLFWSFLEINVAVVCACLPAMVPLAQAISGAFSTSESSSRSAAPGKFDATLSRQPEPVRLFSSFEADSALVPAPLQIRMPANGRLPVSGRNSNVVSLSVIQLSGENMVRVADKQFVV